VDVRCRCATVRGQSKGVFHRYGIIFDGYGIVFEWFAIVFVRYGTVFDRSRARSTLARPVSVGYASIREHAIPTYVPPRPDRTTRRSSGTDERDDLTNNLVGFELIAPYLGRLAFVGPYP
jgi:hypothetical protein